MESPSAEFPLLGDPEEGTEPEGDEGDAPDEETEPEDGDAPEPEGGDEPTDDDDELTPVGEGEEGAVGEAEAVDDEWPFEVELLELSDLLVDHTYQRPIEERFVVAMAEKFDETLVGVIDVSDRGNGDYAILDGQQRYETMKVVGKTTCFAATFTDMTIQDEAGFFFRKNRDRRSMKGYYGFRARLIAGDPTAVAVEETVRTAGFGLGPKSDHTDVIGAIGSTERAWGQSSDVRRDCLTPALRTIGAAWRGRDDSLHGSVIEGFARFWKTYRDEEVDWPTLIGALQGEINGPKNLLGLGRERQGTTGLARAVASVVAWGYNRALPDHVPPLDLDRIT